MSTPLTEAGTTDPSTSTTNARAAVEETTDVKVDAPSHSDPGRQALRDLFLQGGSKTRRQLAIEEQARRAAAAAIKVDPSGVFINTRAERAHARLLVQLAGWAIKERLDELNLGTRTALGKCPTVDPVAEFHERLLNVPYVALAFMPMVNREEDEDSLAQSIKRTMAKFEEEGSLPSLYAGLSTIAGALLHPRATKHLIAKVKMLCSFDCWMDVERITKVYHSLLLVLLSHQVMQQWVSSAYLHNVDGEANWVDTLGPVLGPVVARDPITALRELRSARDALTRHLRQFAFRDDALASIVGFKVPTHN